MKACYDSEAGAISIDLCLPGRWDGGESPHSRGNVALIGDRVANVEVLYPGLGLEEPLHAAAERFNLDEEALLTAARAALSAPDREVSIAIDSREPA